MRIITTIALIGILPCATAKEPAAAKSTTEEQMHIHSKGSIKLADEQDELSADIQQLVIEQTIPPVIELLGQVEEIMDETTDYLLEGKTGGETIAAQTEIIEKIHAAAKKRQNEGEGGGSGSAMMDMMERMMGKKPGDQQGQGKEGDKPGGQSGEDPGQGSTGKSDTANEAQAGDNAGKVEARTVPKASGAAGRAMPDEFRKALDAYNQGVERMIK
jgi:hypothetical protein